MAPLDGLIAALRARALRPTFMDNHLAHELVHDNRTPRRFPSRTRTVHLRDALPIAASLLLTAVAIPQTQFEEAFGRLAPCGNPGSYLVYSGDVDGDGSPDVLACPVLHPCLYLNDGRGNFRDVSATHLPSSVRTFGIWAADFGDVDGDGDLDLFLANGLASYLLVNRGDGRFLDVTSSQMPPLVGSPRSGRFCDLDSDGDPDLIIDDFFPHPHLLLNDGAGRFCELSGAMPSIPGLIETHCADMDGDGDIDLVAADGGTGPLTHVLLNDGRLQFRIASTISRQSVVANMSLADVDADGDTDVLQGRFGDDSLFLNRGDGTLIDVTATHMPPDIYGSYISVADLDLDGDVDVYCANGLLLQQPDRVLVNDGTGRFQDATTARLKQPRPAYESTAATIADFDRDGDPDVVVAHDMYPQGLLSYFANRLRHLDASSAPQLGKPWTLDVYAEVGFASRTQAALVCLNTAAANPPVTVPPFGHFGLAQAGAVCFGPLLISAPRGLAAVTVPVPNDPGLVGQSVYGQALIAHVPGSPATWRLTNVLATTITR